VIASGLLVFLFAQDLIERAPKPAAAAPPAASKPAPGVRRIPFPKDVEGRRLVATDMLAPIVAEEGEILKVLLEDPEKWLARNGLTLLCQASPTLCNVFKHIRANANAARESLQEALRSLEEKVPGFEIISRSEILRACAREAIDRGEHPGRALKACFSSDKLKSALGEWLNELDLGREISRWLGLDADQEKLVRDVLRPIRITAEGVEYVDDPPPLQKRFRERVRVWREAFSEGVDPKRVLEAGLAREDLARLKALPSWIRDRYVATFAYAVSRVEIERDAAEVDVWLERLDAAVGAPEHVKAPARQLRAENRAAVEQIRREAETARKLQEAVTAFRDDVDREIAARLDARMDALARRGDAERFARDGRPWGALPK
jgi:hypothetical protein